MKSFGRWLNRLTGARRLQSKATAAVRDAFAEPAESDAQWLTSAAGNADVDHSRWELRYAKRAMILLAAQRDSLDDLTPSAVARAIEAALATDPNVDTAKRDVAEKQFNARLRSYGEALRERSMLPLDERLGYLLLNFAGRQFPDAASVRQGGELLMRYLQDANASLRQQFGTVTLPEDVRPSTYAGRTPR